MLPDHPADALRYRPDQYQAGAGRTTARDYLAFLQMLMNGGKFNGAQALRPETVAAAAAV